MYPTARRMAASVLAWTVGAVASVFVGLLALSSIQAGTAAGPPQQLAPDGFTNAESGVSNTSSPAAEDAAVPGSSGTPSAPPTTPRSSGSPGATMRSVQRLLVSSGGTVTARCTGASAYLVSWSPAQGYQVSHVLRGPASKVAVTFRSATGRTGIAIHCVAGTPTLSDDTQSDGEPGDN
jgi:hypothetical protein